MLDTKREDERLVDQVFHTNTSRSGTRVDLRNLRAWRLAKLISQEDLAARAGVAKTTIMRLEHQEKRQFANLVTVRKLAAGLDLSPEQLVYGEPSMSSTTADPKPNRAA